MRKLLEDYLNTTVGKYQFRVIALDVYFEITHAKPKVCIPESLIKYYTMNNLTISCSPSHLHEPFESRSELSSGQTSQ